MEVDKELLEKVASVARLKLTDKEIDKFAPQMKEILDFFGKLQEVDTEGIRPSFQPIEIKNRLREDVIVNSLSQEDALRNSSLKKDGYFKGPKAV
ncbi:Asp-tRNA(Asn)/Glu-tRNA(Gln) amidotransferase subunit GatC [Candidatus Woesearchaeota archaeon]|nr:Asp-tRNA(Asn)/Glu-tRNA(Gln) amidotransferase subunit GatC [Candidatus Woesearchaeota archaeon]